MQGMLSVAASGSLHHREREVTHATKNLLLDECDQRGYMKYESSSVDGCSPGCDSRQSDARQMKDHDVDDQDAFTGHQYIVWLTAIQNILPKTLPNRHRLTSADLDVGDA